jgi:leader peptidase (prepilin peptidase) / N-methyltransferase
MLLLTYITICGLVLGSFYNVVGLRVPLKESIVRPRSACPQCRHQLTAKELVPVFSYMFQGGKCSRCKAAISPIYPLTELMTGLLFLAAPLVLGWTSELFAAWTLISLFMIVFVSDIKYMIIPDKVLLVFAGIFLFVRIFVPLTPWWDGLLGGAAAFLALLFIAVISKGGMGGGDIKLMALVGFAVGTKLVILSFFLATLYGAVFGMIGLAAGTVKKGKPIPFGPFIGLGTLTAYFFGDELISAYLELLSLGI